MGLAVLVWCSAGVTGASQTNETVNGSVVLTNIAEIWSFTGEAAGRQQRHRTEVIIYYFDAEWNCAWGECLGHQAFLPIADAPHPLKSGQRVLIDGWVLPSRQRILWRETTVKILEEGLRPPALELADLGRHSADAAGRIVSVNLAVEGINLIEPSHVQIRTHSGTLPGTIHVLTRTDSLPLPFSEGNYVRARGVFVPKANRDGQVVEFDLWAAGRDDVVVTGSLNQDPRFLLPLTPIQRIGEGLPGDEVVRIEGVVRSHELGKKVIIWDNTAQATIESDQVQRLEFGDRIEAVGLPSTTGVQYHLREATYRFVQKAEETSPSAETNLSEPIRMVARIQALDASRVSRHPAVDLRGVLMWSHPETSFIYVQDGSGGIRVVNPSWETNLTPGTVVTVQGYVAPGDYVPIVTNAAVRGVGWKGFDPPQPLNLEQALVGGADGSWVEMRAFVRSVSRSSGLTRLDLSTSHGELSAWTPGSSVVDSLRGAIVRIDGVCSAIANRRGQLTGIELWSPDPLFIRMDEPENRNVFATVLRPIRTLRQFNLLDRPNRRLKTIGTVVLHRAGRYLCLQEGPDSVFVLSRQGGQLTPGDRVEVVGFPGNEHGRFLLREAVFRRLSAGSEPAPVLLSAGSVNTELSGLMAKGDGVLINKLQKDDQVRLLVRSGGATFEAALDAAGKGSAETFRQLPIGSEISLTGVYEVQSDEYGRAGSFLLLLRSWDDVRVVAPAPWWTLPRLMTLLVAIVIASVASLLWGITASRKNSLLRRAHADLENVNRELESFSYSVSHDLRAPLRSIDGFSRGLLEDYEDKLGEQGKEDLHTIRAASQRMDQLISDMLRLSHITRIEMRWVEVNLSQMAGQIAEALRKSEPKRNVEFVIAPHLVAMGDPSLLRIALENILENAWKYSGGRPAAKIEFGRMENGNGPVYFVRDNGCGFDMTYSQKLFGPFQRLHSGTQFSGTGVGLASVRRVIQRHGGRVWIEGKVDAGATLYFTLPRRGEPA